MSRILQPVMGLRLDKVVAPDTHFSGSSDEPSPFVNIEFHQPLIAHFQKQGLAGLLIREICALHDFVDLEWLLAKRIQDILAILQHHYSP